MGKWVWNVFVVSVFSALGVMTVHGLHGQSADRESSLQTALVRAVRDLGSCQSDLGALRSLQADVIDGRYLDWATVKVQLETANPSVTLNLETKKLTPREAK